MFWIWGRPMSATKKPFGVPYQQAMIEYAQTKGVGKGAIAVLRVLLDHCNGETGQSRPGRKRIMARSGYATRRLDDLLKLLRDEQVIMPIAYANGGRGCATVYAFALPAWAGQANAKTPAKNTVESEGYENQNPRKVCEKPPQSLRETPAKIADPTEGPERTEGGAGFANANEGPPSRRQGATVRRPETAEEQRQFSKWVDLHGYGRARELWQEMVQAESWAAE